MYREILDTKFRKIKFSTIYRADDKKKFCENIDKLYEEICESMVESCNEVCNLLYKPNYKVKQKWWSNELQNLKKKITETREIAKFAPSEDNRLQNKMYKKQFRKIQRRNIFLYEQGKVKNIENLFEINNKTDFWKAFNAYKSGNKTENIDEYKSNQLFEHFKNNFQKQNIDLVSSEMQNEVINRVNLYKEECKAQFHNNEAQYISRMEIEEYIDVMKGSNSSGWDGISSNMLKYGKSDSLIDLIKNLMNAIIRSGHIPLNFNRSIIHPVIKDSHKKTFDPNNYRPISVSNCLAQIFERFILSKSPKLQSTAETQFGFKMGMSTYQPIFLLKETISKKKSANQQKQKSPCYLTSLDAEKAFDSLWRKGLFFKLIDHIDMNLWLLLESYYNQSDGAVRFQNGLQIEIKSDL